MNPQLQRVLDEFEEAQARLHRLVEVVLESSWMRRPHPDRWSVGECVAHLNLTAAAYVPLLRQGIVDARRLNGPRPSRYRRDPIGWLLWKTMGPPVRFRTNTAAPFVPGATDTPGRLVEEFDRLQQEQISCVRDADGLPIGRIRVASPFDARVRYSLFACLTILPRHQHRHLWQAEHVWPSLS